MVPKPDTSPATSRGARVPLATARVMLACVGYWAVALLLVSRVPAIEAFGIRITVLTARAALALVGLHAVQVGQVLSVGRTGVSIASDCSPHLPFLIFAGGVLASPASWRHRALGLALGAIAIHLFNTARILALMAVLATRPAWFDFAHVYLWQVGTIVAVIAAFALWLPWTASRPAAA